MASKDNSWSSGEITIPSSSADKCISFNTIWDKRSIVGPSANTIVDSWIPKLDSIVVASSTPINESMPCSNKDCLRSKPPWLRNNIFSTSMASISATSEKRRSGGNVNNFSLISFEWSDPWRSSEALKNLNLFCFALSNFDRIACQSTAR